jgi:hypothetical protein
VYENIAPEEGMGHHSPYLAEYISEEKGFRIKSHLNAVFI